MNLQQRIEVLSKKGYKLQERITDVTQFFELPFDEETLTDDYTPSSELVETNYDLASTEVLLLDSNEDIVCQGSLEDIHDFIMTMKL